LLVDVIDRVEDLTPVLRNAYMGMAEVFDKNMPKALYMDYYELAELSEASPLAWEKFLDVFDVKRYISDKVAKMTEIAARKTLDRLANSHLNASDISAIKEILSNAQDNQKSNELPQVVFTFIPKSELI